jgi:hypothetical protein
MKVSELTKHHAIEINTKDEHERITKLLKGSWYRIGGFSSLPIYYLNGTSSSDGFLDLKGYTLINSKEIEPNEKPYPKWMLVGNGEYITKNRRYVLGNFNGFYLAVAQDYEQSFAACEYYDTATWKLAKDIEETKKITIEVTEEQEVEINKILNNE